MGMTADHNRTCSPTNVKPQTQALCYTRTQATLDVRCKKSAETTREEVCWSSLERESACLLELNHWDELHFFLNCLTSTTPSLTHSLITHLFQHF
jgi:hypothetical protein